jgi:hypothetical protein
MLERREREESKNEKGRVLGNTILIGSILKPNGEG